MRKWLIILLCIVLCGCQLQENGIQQTPETNEENETTTGRVELSDTLSLAFYYNQFDSVLLRRSTQLFPVEFSSGRYGPRYISIYHTQNTEKDSPQINIVYDRENENHEFIVSNFKFSYLTGGNVRAVTTNFYIEPTEFIESFSYNVFDIEILTQDNVTLKVSYDIDKKEFFDASEGALENDVMNFNASMKESLLFYCARVIDTLRNDLAVIEAFDKEYTKYIASDKYEIVKANELSIPYFYTPYDIEEIITTTVYRDESTRFTINYETVTEQSLWEIGLILYLLEQSFDTPSDIFKQNEFIPLGLIGTKTYGCIGNNCYIEDDTIVKLPYAKDGYLNIYSINHYNRSIKEVFGIDSTYQFTTGINTHGFYEDENKGILVAYGPDGDGPVIPCGIYITNKEEVDGLIKLSYKKYDLNEFMTWEDVDGTTAHDYEKEFTDTIMTYPTWIATLKYDSETDNYQIISLSKE